MSLQRITELCFDLEVLIMNVPADFVHVIKYVLCAYQPHGYDIM